jgi:hypothetical protein
MESSPGCRARWRLRRNRRALEAMSLIQRAIQVGYQLRVYFTEDVFHPANVVLRNILGPGDSLPARRALVVLDEALAAA